MRSRPDLAKRNAESAVGFENQYVPEPNSGCWLWLGALKANGYGHINISGATTPAHRYSWVRHRGPIPEGAHVLHRCDVRGCVNPDHLFLGDNAANVADKMLKGRHVAFPGEMNGNAKLSASDIPLIRSDQRPNTVIGRDYGVSNVLIGLIKRQKAWRHIQ